ncbi:BnaC03g54850D [Brassica napus]|uniref:BnaC03g54850D protein n=1 Tax=Brassica napus TaxID=3708 RepID=A0A078F6H8_BRANA|nr:BnaC03g54850D [Brassica napus]
MGDRSDRRLESSFVGSKVRSRNQIKKEPPRSADSSDLSLDLMVEVESPRSATVAEAEGSPSTIEVGRFQPVGPVLKIGVEEVDKWKDKYGLSDEVVIRVPGPFDRVSDFGVDEVPVYECFFESGFRDCVPSLVAKVSEFLDISPGQLNPFSWRTLIAIQNLGDLEGLILGVEEILYSYFVCPMHVGESRLYLHSRHRTPPFPEIPKKDRKRHPDFESGWTEKFAFMILPDVSCLTSSVGRNTIERFWNAAASRVT